jgi:acylphosphatase
METKRYFVSGRVQGVGFRFFTQREAGKLGISGFVRNVADGRVEVLASGSKEQLGQLREALKRGPRFSSVESVVEEDVESTPDDGAGFYVA